MSAVVAFTQADAIGWLCFVVGVAVMSGGVGIGIWISVKRTPQTAEDAKAKIEEARSKIDETKMHLEETRTASTAGGGRLESAGGATPEAATAAAEAGASAEAASSALEQVQGIVGSLPENIRFAGLLVLVGTVLIGVATIQFGGVSLF